MKVGVQQRIFRNRDDVDLMLVVITILVVLWLQAVILRVQEVRNKQKFPPEQQLCWTHRIQLETRSAHFADVMLHDILVIKSQHPELD